MKQEKCLFCGSLNTKGSFYPEVLFNNKVFNYKQCNECKLNFNTPLLTGDDYNALYPVSYHDEFYFKPEKTYASQLEILRQFPTIKTFVDYGCGDAGLIASLSGAGYKCSGVEFNEVLVQKLRKYHPGISFYTVQEFDQLSDNYDCIHLGDVLEHMTDPNGIVLKLKGRLKPESYLFVEGPLEHNFSLGYWFRKLFLRIRKQLSPDRRVEGQPYHTFLANRANQKAMLEKNGLSTELLKLYETAWPFPEKSVDCKTVKSFVEFFIGKISIFFSSLSKNWGNRFYFIGKSSN